MLWRFTILAILVLGVTSNVDSKSLKRSERQVPNVAQLPASGKQAGMGLSALGTLISPLLFLMGMGSFISMLPQMFQTVLSGVGSNLIQSFTGAAASQAAGGSSSTRLKRSIIVGEEDLLKELENRLNLAVLKYERPVGV